MTLPHQELEGSKRVGQMTAAMRVGVGALAALRGPKLLRVGVVHAGSVREERTFTTPADVRVGSNEGNTFILARAVQPSFCLFERVGEAYQLNFTDSMQGRIALSSGLFELQALKTPENRVANGAYRIALHDESRGRVTLGEVAFLFHFVEPLPMRPKAVLPAAVLRGSGGVDWSSTIAAAFSFLLHFMLLGAVYSDWADPVIDDDLSTAGLVDSLKNLPPPPEIEDKSPPDEQVTPPRAEQRPLDPTPKSGAKARGDRPAPARAPEVAALTEQLAKIDTSIIGALATTKPATSDVLRPKEVAWGALDSAAASASGVGSSAHPRLPSAGAPIRTDTLGDFRDLGKKTREEDRQARAVVVRGPRAVTNLAGPPVVAGVVSNAARVVADMRAGFRACYQRGLAENPDASGNIRLTIRVGAGGEVAGVTASPSGNLPPTVVSCVQARARAAQFDAPEGGSAVILVPVNFIKQ